MPVGERCLTIWCYTAGWRRRRHALNLDKYATGTTNLANKKILTYDMIADCIGCAVLPSKEDYS
jgi:hypothetical protein